MQTKHISYSFVTSNRFLYQHRSVETTSQPPETREASPEHVLLRVDEIYNEYKRVVEALSGPDKEASGIQRFEYELIEGVYQKAGKGTDEFLSFGWETMLDTSSDSPHQADLFLLMKENEVLMGAKSQGTLSEGILRIDRQTGYTIDAVDNVERRIDSTQALKKLDRFETYLQDLKVQLEAHKARARNEQMRTRQQEENLERQDNEKQLEESLDEL